MSNENMRLDIFIRRVLACIKEQRRSVKDVHEEYMRLYPPGFFMRQFSSSIPEYKVEIALKKLQTLGFLSKEITRYYRDKTLRQDIATYCMTNKGRSFLLAKKK
jgi:S-methylmethionine-dependent homocysteine/selenocysteine methylase